MTNTPNPTDETITELARWLFTIEYSYFTNSDDIVYISANGDRRRFVISDIPKWIKSAEGLEAVENAMIERGWSWESAYEDRQYRFSFLKDGFESVFWAKTKAAAALPAAYWAMKKEL